MMSNLLLVCGVAVLTWALRTCKNRTLHRAGTLGVFLTSFLAGWLLGDSLLLGALFAASWLFLPWLEILTRVRKLRLPNRQIIEPEAPPSAHHFPGLHTLTQDIEESGFEHVEDAGWNFEDLHHFYRLFYHGETRTLASLCLISQEDLSYYYLSLSSVTPGRETRVVSWNFPFSYSMKIPPHWKVQRVDGDLSCADLLERHRKFLESLHLPTQALEVQSAEELLVGLEESAEEQIEHNYHVGVLTRDSENQYRYTARGMFFLWRQFLRDLIRLS
jgi:hypothetical protein